MSNEIGQYEQLRTLALDGKLLGLGGVREGTASQYTLFDFVAGKVEAHVALASHVLASVMVPDGVALGLLDGGLVLLSRKGEVRSRVQAHTGRINGLAVSPDGTKVISAGQDGALRVWAVSGLDKLAEWVASPQALRAVAVDPAGEYVATGGDDGVVRSFKWDGSARREMPGHTGTVNALAFTPRDGRLCSVGEDGKLRFWYLVGAVECEERGSADGHEGAITALLIPPTPPAPAPGEEPIDRVITAGQDGAVKAWRLDKKIKPRTLDTGSKPLYALAFAPSLHGNAKQAVLGTLFVAGDDRTVRSFIVQLDGNPDEHAAEKYRNGFDVLADALNAPARPRREQAIVDAVKLDEPEALQLLLKTLAGDKDSEVRASAALALARHGRRGAKMALRERLNDDKQPARFAALQALQILDVDQPLNPLRFGLGSKFADLRIHALKQLPALAAKSPLATGLVADKLTDSDATVAIAALDQLQAIAPQSQEPLRTAFEKGSALLKVEALIRTALAGWASTATLKPILSRALDDADGNVRRVAFAVRVLERKPLAHVLEARDEDFGNTLKDVLRRGAQLLLPPRPAPPAGAGGKAAPPGPTDADLAEVKSRLPGEGQSGGKLEEADLEPLLAAMACRTADTALRGARGLAWLSDPRALGALLQLSREAEGNIRKNAASSLKELQDPRARKRLVWMLDDADANVRNAALDALARFSETAPLTLAEEALHGSFEDIRVRGLDRLVKAAAASGPSAEAEALLGDALEDEASKVRDEAFRTLWSWHTKDPQKALDRALTGRFADLRLRAIAELLSKGTTQGSEKAAEPWVVERLLAEISDRDASVAQAAYDAYVKVTGKEKAEGHLAALASTHPAVRASGAKGAIHAPPEPLRGALVKQLEDDAPDVRTAAVETLAKLFPTDNSPLVAALGSSRLDVRVRAAELLATRRDESLIGPMRALLSDKELAKLYPANVLAALRHRAATALASLGSPRLLNYFGSELLKSDEPGVREQAARGLATASRRGDEGYLLDALGHADVAVRSWAADGLSRLGDARALPVLVGNLRNDHLPIRLGSILSFAALGQDGTGGMLHGLEDAAREIQEMVFAIVLSRDLASFRLGQPPDLLTSALSSGRPEVRFSAARALELRTDVEPYLGHLVDILLPEKPDKASDMKDWPPEDERERLMVSLASALGADLPEQRYAAAQVLLFKNKPVDYFREAGRAGRLANVDRPWTPDTSPTAVTAPGASGKPRQSLRRMFSTFVGGDAQDPKRAAEHQQLRRLAFGAYVGLLRQVSSGDDEGHRVRRDAIDRIVELTRSGSASPTSAIPALLRALDDPHHLVRKAALAGLKRIYPDGAEEPLALALASTSADVGKVALDELFARGGAARPRIVAALDSPIPEVRKHAFELLEKLSPPGSLDPLLAAIGSQHSDLRIGVIERLATSNDARVTQALSRAMESDREDLRIRAAELLAERGDDRSVDVLAVFLRHEDNAALRNRAAEALVRLRTDLAVKTVAARLDDVTDAGARATLVKAMGRMNNPSALPLLAERLDDEGPEVRNAAFGAAMDLAGRDRKKRDMAKAMQFLPAALRSHDAAIRSLGIKELDHGDDENANGLMVAMFTDRDATARLDAVTAYAKRVILKDAPVGPLEEVIKGGTRELMLPAAEGVAERRGVSALRPLLLYVRAGQGGERERALRALGALGDERGLSELEVVAAGGTEEAPADVSMQQAAVEGLGRLSPQLKDAEVQKRLLEKMENWASDAGPLRKSAVVGLRSIGGEKARLRIEAVLGDTGAAGDVAQAAAEQLGKFKEAASEPVLAWAIKEHGNQAVRKAAREALDATFPTERTRIEFMAVDSRFPEISDPAAAYLAAEGDPSLLIPRLGTLKRPELRQHLAYGLLRRSALPVAALQGLLRSPAPETREQAAWLIGNTLGMGRAQIAAVDVQALGEALSRAEGEAAQTWSGTAPQLRAATSKAWVRLLWALGQTEAPRTAEVAAARLGQAELAVPAAVRGCAAEVLSRLGTAMQGPAVEKALQDADPAVRASAAQALVKLQGAAAGEVAARTTPFDAVAFAPAGKVLKRVDTHAARQLAVPAMLAKQDAGALLEAARSDDKATRLDALAALGRIPTEEVFALLSELAFDEEEPEEVKKAAYRALKRGKRLAEKAQKAAPAAGSAR